jgi:hypothetical protein
MFLGTVEMRSGWIRVVCFLGWDGISIETLSHFAQNELSGTMTVRGMQAKSRDINLELTARRRALCSRSFAQHIHQRCRDPFTASRNYGVRYGVERKKREAVNR